MTIFLVLIKMQKNSQNIPNKNAKEFPEHFEDFFLHFNFFWSPLTLARICKLEYILCVF